MITNGHIIPPLTRELKRYREDAEKQGHIDCLYAVCSRNYEAEKQMNARTVEAIANLTADLCFSLGIK